MVSGHRTHNHAFVAHGPNVVYVASHEQHELDMFPPNEHEVAIKLTFKPFHTYIYNILDVPDPLRMASAFSVRAHILIQGVS